MCLPKQTYFYKVKRPQDLLASTFFQFSSKWTYRQITLLRRIVRIILFRDTTSLLSFLCYFKNKQREKREHNLSNPFYFLTSC